MANVSEKAHDLRYGLALIYANNMFDFLAAGPTTNTYRTVIHTFYIKSFSNFQQTCNNNNKNNIHLYEGQDTGWAVFAKFRNWSKI